MRVYFLLLMLLGAPQLVCAGEAGTISPQALMQQREQLLVIDVRSQEEYAQGHVPGARHMAHDDVAANLSWLRAYQDQPIVLYCRTGRRSGMVKTQLQELGFTAVSVLEGDMSGWQAAGLPIEKGEQ